MRGFFKLCAAFVLIFGAQAFAQDRPIPTISTNYSVKITTGLTYQLVAAAGPRGSMTIQNNNTGDNCFIELTGVVVAGNTTTTNVTVGGVTLTAAQASILLQPGQSYSRYYPLTPSGPIVTTCATAGDSLYVDFQ